MEELDQVNFRKYWLLLKKWAWLLILGILIGAAAGYYNSINRTPIYRATTKVMVTSGGTAIESPNSYYSFYASQLTDTYIELLKTEPVQVSVSERLGINLEGVSIDAKAKPNTPIIEISVSHTSPMVAAAVANSLVEVLIEKNNEIQTGRYLAMEKSLIEQKTQLETQIANLQEQIQKASTQTLEEQEVWQKAQITTLEANSAQLQNEITVLATPVKPKTRENAEQKKARLEQEALLLAQKKVELEGVNLLLALYRKSYSDLVVYGKLADAEGNISNPINLLLGSTQALYQSFYQSILSNLESVRMVKMENTPDIVSIESAEIPSSPINMPVMRDTFMSGFIGLVIAFCFVILRNLLDNTIKTTDNIEELLGQYAIGYIGAMEGKTPEDYGMYVSRRSRSQIAESFRNLRTNIEFSAIDSPIKVLLITSPEPGTGKTTIATNLAIIFSQKGKRILLLDADLRRPHVHKLLNLKNRWGLTDLLLENQDASRYFQHVQGIDHLSVLTTGSIPPNPSELLGSSRMVSLLQQLKEQEDIIIIDSPPSIVSDSQLLASIVDAVLIILQPGRTHIEPTKDTIRSFINAKARIIGVVMNRISRKNPDYYGKYYYQGLGYTDDTKKPQMPNNQEIKAENRKRINPFRKSI